MELDRGIMRETTRDFQTYYSPKLHGEIRLDTNTNVLGSNPAAERYLRESRWDLNGYPDTYSRNLREALGELYGLDPECIIAGNGSDEMIDVIFKTFTNWGDNSVVPVPSYSLYDYFVKMNGGRAIPVDLTEDFQLDVDSMVRQENAKVTIVPSPNNPTGNCFRSKDLEDLISSFSLTNDEAAPALEVGLSLSALTGMNFLGDAKLGIYGTTALDGQSNSFKAIEKITLDAGIKLGGSLNVIGLSLEAKLNNVAGGVYTDGFASAESIYRTNFINEKGEDVSTTFAGQYGHDYRLEESVFASNLY